MAAPWASDRDLSIDLVIRLVASQFAPTVRAERIVLLGSGWDSDVYEVNETWVFRFPKRRDVEPWLERERSVLPLIRPHLPAAVPEMVLHGKPDWEFPFSFVGYRKLPGTPIDELEPGFVDVSALLRGAIRFLAALHRLPVGLVSDAGLPTATPPVERREAILARLAAVIPQSRDPEIDAAREVLRDLPYGSAGEEDRACLIHADFRPEHILVDPKTATVTGIIDWGDMAIGDPACDFGGLLFWAGRNQLVRALSASDYPVDGGLIQRAIWNATCASLEPLAAGLENNDPELATFAREMLRQATAK